MAVKQGKTKVDSLEQFLLNAGIDLTYEKPTILTNDEGMVRASDAWTTHEQGIRDVIESRAMELRKEILFTCNPVELASLRERLVELAQVIQTFKSAKEGSERLSKQKEGEDAEKWDNSVEEPDDPDDTSEDKSSM